MSGANVQLDAIRDFRVALIKFIELAGIAMSDAESEVHRTLHWLELEQVPYWHNQIRSREIAVQQWKEKVREKTLYKDALGSRQSAIDEMKRLKVAEARLAEAHERFDASKQYVRRLQKQQMEYRGQVQKLALALGGEGAACVAKLQNLQNLVAEYTRAESATEARSMAQSATPLDAPPPSPADEPKGT